MATVRELIGNFYKTSVLSGADGLEKQIESVSFIDAPNSVDWLKGGELILTTAFLYKENERMQFNFVEKLIEKGVVALGIKLGRFVNSLPPSIIKLSDDNAFPIFAISLETVWSEVITAFYEVTQNKPPQSILSTEIITFDKLFRISTWDSALIRKRFLQCISIAAVIVNNEYEILGFNGKQPMEQLKLYCKMKNTGKSDPEFDVLINKKLLIDVQIMPDERLVLIGAQNKINEREIQWVKSLYESISRRNSFMRSDKARWESFIKDCIAGDFWDSRGDYIQGFDYNQFKMFNVLLFIGEGAKGSIELLKERLRAMHGENKIYYSMHDEKPCAVAVLCMHTDLAPEANACIRDILNKDSLKTKVCDVYAGESVNSMELLKKSYERAVFTKKIGKVHGHKALLYTDVLIWDSLLKSNIDLSEISYLNDKFTSFDACKTLEAYLESGNYKRAGEITFVHDNTIRYRIGKINQLLNVDLDNPVTRLSLMVKVKLWKYNKYLNDK